MNAICLISIIFLSTLQQVTKKAYNKRGNGAFSFSAGTALTAIVIFLLTSGGNLQMDPAMLPYSLLFAVTYSSASVCSFLAIRTGPLSLTVLITSYSLVIPALWGLIFLNEPVSTELIVGIVLLIVSLFLINGGKKNDERKVNWKWGIFALFAFVGNGACSTVQKMQQIRFDGAYKSEFMIIALAITVCVLLITAAITEKKALGHNLMQGAPWFLIGGLSNGGLNFLVLVLSTRMPASLMFPLLSAGSIVSALAVSVFLYREKLSRKQLVGVVLGIAAIVAFNL